MASISIASEALQELCAKARRQIGTPGGAGDFQRVIRDRMRPYSNQQVSEMLDGLEPRIAEAIALGGQGQTQVVLSGEETRLLNAVLREPAA